MPDTPWKTVWITGASTGIGRALALRLAAAGAVVAVSARSEDKLRDLAHTSPALRPYPVDVTDAAAMAATVAAIEKDIGPIDLAVLNAGTWQPMSASRFDGEKAINSMAVNYAGVTNGLAPVMPRMIERQSGQIAIVASVAGYRGLPRTAAYGPTKAALINLAESLHSELKGKGVVLSVVNPGFVATPMTAVNKFPMPFLVSEDEAARAIDTGLRRKRFEVVFPWQMAIAMKVLRLLPYRLFFWISGRML